MAGDAGGRLTTEMGQGISAVGNGLTELEAAKLALALNALANGAALGNEFGNSAMALGRNGISGVAVIPGMMVDAARRGMETAINWGDSATQGLNQAIRTGAVGGAQMFDSGLNAFGVQQPVMVPAVEGVWTAGENGRRNAFNFGRQGLTNAGRYFGQINPSGLAGGASGGVAGIGLGIPSAAVGGAVAV